MVVGMAQIEYKDGEIFTFDGKTYQAREFALAPNEPIARRCGFCAFHRYNGGLPVCTANFRFACHKYKRSDLKWVNFKRIND